MVIYEIIHDLQSFIPDLSEYKNTVIVTPSAFKGQKQTEHAKYLISTKSKQQWIDGKKVFDQSFMKSRVKTKYGVDNVWHLKGECPHCGKQGQLTALKRWHFDKCKHYHASTHRTG